jgi:predicted helicase
MEYFSYFLIAAIVAFIVTPPVRKNAIYAKLVLKCGSRLYWEDWAADVAKIAEKQPAADSEHTD